jgi:hypothetical protein
MDNSTIVENVQTVMKGLESISYNRSSTEQGSISLFKTSYNGIAFLKDNTPKLKQAVNMWLGIVESQILHINNDSYDLMENLPDTPDTYWMKCLVKLKKQTNV